MADAPNGPDLEPDGDGDRDASDDGTRDAEFEAATPEDAADGRGDDDGGDEEGPIGLVEARQRASEAADELLEQPLDNVVRVERTDDGWRVLVEVLERSAVPDTQDILGRYEITVDPSGTLTGYGLVERYRRGERRDEI
jgi:hypothetical protein